MRKIIASAALFSILCGNAYADGSNSVSMPIHYVIDHLDVTTFPNSLGPRRVEGKHTFKDYGFLPITLSETSTTLEDAAHDWQFTVKLLDDSTICIEDQARNGGSYHTQTAYRLFEADKYLSAGEVTNSHCPTFAK